MKSLQNISYKTLFTILFLSLAGIVFFLRIGKPANKVSAAWWDEMWHYRKAISIDNTSGSNLTDFQVSISIGTSQLVAEGKMQSDCDDIRITDINGNLLPHWIEENNPGCNQLTDTKIWLKANSLPTSGATIYIYYGNQQADNYENGNNVFELFDDFSTGLNNWSIFTGIHYGGTLVATINSGQLILTGTNAEGGIYKNNFVTTNGIVEFTARADQLRNGNDMGAIARRQSNTQYYDMGVNWGDNTTARIAKDAGHTNLASTSYTYGSGVFRLISGYFSGSSLQTYVDNNFKIGVTDATYSSPGNVGIAMDAGHESGGLSVQWTIDNFRVRKYATIQPVPSVQSEELGTAPIAYWKFDEGSGTTAYDSAGNNNGTLSGTTLPEWQNEDQCISGKCLNFQGLSSTHNSTLTNNLSNIVSSSTSFTMTAWINLHGPPTNYCGVIISAGSWNTDNGYWKFGIHYAGGVYTGPQLGYGNAADMSYVFQLNKWYFLTWTSNNGTNYFYVDGKYIGSSVDSAYSTTTIPKIGQASYGNYFNFNGLIDDLKIYNYIRTADQIKQDYNSRGSMSGSSVNLGVRSNTAPSIKSSLIAHYRFDEGNGTSVYDSSGNNNTGTLGDGSSSPSWSIGKANNSLNFDSNDYVTLPNDLGYTTTVSAFAWLKTNGTPVGGYHIVFGGSQLEISIPTSGQVRTGINTDTRYVSNHGSGVTDGKWHYVGFTFDGSTKKTYIDGQFVGEQTGIGGTLVSSFSNRTLGKLGSSSAYFLNGYLDEVKIYNTALTPEEVKQDYNQGSVVQFGSTNQTIGGTTTSLEYCIPGDTSYCASPIAEWKMDEGIGTSTVDTSGNNKNGTFNNSPTWFQGKIGKALSFNPTNNNSVTTTFNSQLTTYTAEAWVKPNSLGSGIDNTVMAASSSYPLWITIANGEVRAYAFTNSTSVYGQTNGTNIETNKWYHIAVSATQNGIATIYVNGIGQTSFTSDNISWPSGSVITIGDLRASRNLNFNGIIDHVKIYDYARTPAQIAYDYNKGGPIGWWKFDECQGNIAYDWSGVGNTGAINIGPSGTQNSLGTCAIGTSAAWTNGATGKINSSLSFGGVDDYVNIGNKSELQMGTGAVSVSHWIKLTGLTNYRMTFFGGGFGGATGYGIGFQSGTTTLRYETMGSSGGRQVFTVDGGITLNNWHHVTGIFDGINNVMKLYVDGVQKHSIGISDPGTVTNNSNFSIGSYNASQEYFFLGQIDDVRIYNYALTNEQIKTIYNNGAVNFN